MFYINVKVLILNLLSLSRTPGQQRSICNKLISYLVKVLTF